MTEEEAIRELKEYRYNKAIEQQKLEMIEEIRNECMKVTSSLNDMPQSPTPNVHRIEEKYIRYLDLQSEVLELLNNDMIKAIRITKKIQTLAQPYRTILELKYIRGEPIWQIADEIDHSIRTTNRIHQEAIKKYANL